MDKEIRINEGAEICLERLREAIPPDDVYIFVLYLLDNIGRFSDGVYFRSTPTYTGVCADDPELLDFLNLVGRYEELMKA